MKSVAINNTFDFLPRKNCAVGDLWLFVEPMADAMKSMLCCLLLVLFCIGSASSHANNPPQGRLVASFSYNAEGLRIEKQGERGIERYTYDDQSVLSQRDGSNALVARYTYGPNRLISLEHKTEGTQFYLTDALNSIVDLMTTDGLVQARYQYDAFGNKRSESGSSWNRFAFTGYEEDKETNLLYAKARYYDADTGRFLSQDPWQGENNTPPSLHKYLYAYQNPTVWFDPTGMSNDNIHKWIDSKGNTHYGDNANLSTAGNKGENIGLGKAEISANTVSNQEKSKAIGKTICKSGSCPGMVENTPEENAAISSASNSTTVTAENKEGPSGDPDVDSETEDREFRHKGTVAALNGMGAGADIVVSVVNPGKAAFDGYEAISHLTPEQAYNTYQAIKEAAIENPRATAAMAALITVCKGKCADDIERTAVKEEIKVANTGGKYTVGAYKEIKGTVPGLDAHHVGQKTLMKDMIPGYDAATAPSILVPKVGHTIKGPNGIVSRSTEGLTTPRGVLARDISELRRVYPDVPNLQLQKLIQMNKDIYPGSFSK